MQERHTDQNVGNLKAPVTGRDRQTFESRYQERADLIDRMNIVELKAVRVDLKRWLENTDITLNEHDMKTNDSKRKYFIELRRRVIAPLLNRSKTRLKQINVVLYNGTTKEQAVRFIDVAAEILPMHLFQKIYGLTIGDEKRHQKIEEIRTFLAECDEQAMDSDGNKSAASINNAVAMLNFTL